MKPDDVKTNIGFDLQNNDKDPKFQVGVHLTISKDKNNFVKGLNKLFLLKNFIILYIWAYVINDFNSEQIVGTFYKKESEKVKKSLKLKN